MITLCRSCEHFTLLVGSHRKLTPLKLTVCLCYVVLLGVNIFSHKWTCGAAIIEFVWMSALCTTPRLLLQWCDSTCEILTRYHAPGAGWYWNPHTAAINIPIYFLTYIFSHYFKKHTKIFFKNGGQQRDSNHRPIDHESRRLTTTPARVLCRNIVFLSCMNLYGINRY